MDVSIVYGVIEYKTSDKAGFCQIIAYRDKERKLQIDEEQIRTTFSDNTIYIGKNLENFNKHDVIEIKFKDIVLYNQETDNYRPKLIFQQPPTPCNVYLSVELRDIDFESEFFDLNLLKNEISDEIKLLIDNRRFYLSCGSQFAGPVRLVNNKFDSVPRGGIDVYSMDEIDAIEYPKIQDQDFENLWILFSIPRHSKKLDCSTKKQLIEWLKSKLINGQGDQKIAELLNQFLTRFSYDSLEDNIEKSRFRRVEKILASLELNSSELAKIKEHPDFKDVLKVAIKEQSDVFAQEIYEEQATIKEKLKQSNATLITQHKNEVAEQKKLLVDLESEITILENMSLEKQVEVDSLETKIDGLKIEETYIQNNIDAITTQLKLTVSTISPQLQAPITNENPHFFERLEFIVDSTEYYKNFYEFEDEASVQGAFLGRNIKKLSETRFFIAEDYSCLSVIRLLKSTSNMIVYLQQAEGNWLTFEKWYKNGLSQFFAEALATPHRNFCFVLQDCNIASPECYAKPILDISKGVRKKVPNSQIDWPDNVWIVFVPLEVNIEDFGFDINDETFNSWVKFEGKDSSTNLGFMLTKKWSLRKSNAS